MNDITNRHHVRLVVETFYSKIRRDDLLSPIFNGIIGSESNWEEHLEKLTDFWETNLFGVRRFKGNPLLKHHQVDIQMDHGITELHFGQWLHLWVTTVNSLYHGENAEKAKGNARKMGTFMFVKLFEARPRPTDQSTAIRAAS